MRRGERWYYTPISVDGQVVRKHVDSILVSREEARATVTVTYTLTNPYDHPVAVPIQSGLTMLYQYAQSDDDPKEPELHVVPATVTRHGNGELLYVAEGSGAVLGTTAIQRQHLGTGIPNYRHPVAVNVTLVPGDSVELEARASLPARVQRMILVDAMVGPGQPYGIYPQLVERPDHEVQTPPPLRVYEGASFRDDPPHVRMPAPAGDSGERARRLPRWVDPVRFARLQATLRQHGKLWSYAVGGSAILLAASLLLRSALANVPNRIVVDAVRLALFAGLTVGLVRRSTLARVSLAAALAVSGVLDLVPLVHAVIVGALPPAALLTGYTLIPLLFLGGATLLLALPPVRAYTARSTRATEAHRE
ncbi:MAG: hypothetical protein ACOC7V_08980 [Spirochaetota bacterium]